MRSTDGPDNHELSGSLRVTGHKHDAKGRSTSESIRKAKLKIFPEQCYHSQPWMHISLELLESHACRALSRNALLALNRIIIEHMHHGLQENGKLIVTHRDFIDYGVTKDQVTPATIELDFFGLVRMRRGRGGRGGAHPNKFRLTWIGDWQGNHPTNEWKTKDQAMVLKWKSERKKLPALIGAERGHSHSILTGHSIDSARRGIKLRVSTGNHTINSNQLILRFEMPVPTGKYRIAETQASD